MNSTLEDPLSRWRRSERPIVLGHRGARDVELENTLEAFERARLQGAAGSEFDVQLSKDARAFVFHDLDLGRVTEGARTERLCDLDTSTLSRVRLPGDRRIPRLEEVLSWGKQHDMLLNIELKSKGALRDAVPRVVADLLALEAGADNRVLVSSFHPLLLRRFRHHASHVPTALIVSEQHRCMLREGWARALDCQAIHPQASMLLERPQTLSSLSEMLVNTWTVNDPDDARRLVDLGINALISDCPGRILASLS